MTKPIRVFILSLLSCTTALAQQNKGMGEVFDLELIAKTPQKIQMSERSFRDMPASYSLEQYTPTPGDQGNFGTCTAWLKCKSATIKNPSDSLRLTRSEVHLLSLP